MTNAELKTSCYEVLTQNILPFWLNNMQDHERGGWYGQMTGRGQLVKDAPRGAILNARLLWTLAASYRVLTSSPEHYDAEMAARCLDAALRTRDYILEHFIDKQHGGTFWSITADGRPLDTKKQTYAIAFIIYGMAELARATGDASALECAVGLFHDIEAHAFDSVGNGYVEALTRDWQPVADMRLSDKDENGSRTMNTHLHVMEAYTALLRVHREERLEHQLRNLIDIFHDHIYNPLNGHLDLFFDDLWQGRRDIASYGHDIEAAWLLTEALDVMGDAALKTNLLPMLTHLVAAAEEGLCQDGSMMHEDRDADRQWWVQCEAVVGEINHYQLSGDLQARDKAIRCYNYILSHLIDRELGEWYWSVRPDGSINLDDDHAGFWKCPYHNGRMCLEVMER